MQADDCLHQGGLAGTVFAKQCKNLSTLHMQLHVLKRLSTAECLGDSGALKHILIILCIVLSQLFSPLILLLPEWGFPGSGRVALRLMHRQPVGFI